MSAPGPLVSIVTPTRNQGRFIEQTIRSVRNQTYRQFEHIVIDGASTDQTLDILQRYEATYPMRWSSEPDGGMYEALNKGLRSARGEIIAYINSDDLYLPWALEVIVSCFRSHLEAGFVYGDAIKIDDASGRQQLFFQPAFDLDYIRQEGFLVQPTVFWRRSVLERQGLFDETLRYVADCDYWMKAGAHEAFVKLDEFVAVERDHGSTLRVSDRDALSAELQLVRARYERPATQRRRVGARVRRWLVYRLQWMTFVVQSMRRRPVRRGPWSRLIDAGRTHVVLTRMPLLVARRRYFDRLVRPSTHWLEPPA